MINLLPKLFQPPIGKKGWVDFAKGVAIILVITYHCILFLRSIEFSAGGMGRAKTAIEMFPMPLFFVVAGMFHFRVVNWTFRQTWQRRMAGYLYLYVLWSVIRFVFYLIVPNARPDGAGATATSPVALAQILWWPISSYWFIWSLLLCTAVLWLVRKSPAWLPVLLSAAVSILFSSDLVRTGNVGWDRTGEYLVFFLTGALFSQRMFAAVQQARPWMVATSGVVYVLTAGLAAFVPIGDRIPGVVLLSQCAVLVFAATASVGLVRVRLLAWISYLGARSLHLYLIHVFIIAALAAIVRSPSRLELLPGRGTLVLAVMVVIVTVLATIVGRWSTRVRWLYVPPRIVGRGRGKSGNGRRRPPSARTTTATAVRPATTARTRDA